VGDLGSDATRREIDDAFSKYGDVNNIWIAMKPPGFAFVLMEDTRDAEDAVRGLDGTRICGRRVKSRHTTTLLSNVSRLPRHALFNSAPRGIDTSLPMSTLPYSA